MDRIISEAEKRGCSLVSPLPFKDVKDVIDEACIHQDKKSYKRGMQKVVEFVEGTNLLVADEPPIDGKPYQFLGCYITRWAETIDPTVAFNRLSDTEEWQTFLADNGLEVKE